MAIKEVKTDIELVGRGNRTAENIKIINDNFAELAGGSGGTPTSPTWDDITNKPTTFAPTIGTSATTALAGNTPLLAIGTTATTAKAGNAVQTATQTTATPVAGGTATNVQAILVELTTRIAALEAAG